MTYDVVLRELHRRRVRYLVVGGLAVNLHGVPRLTYDLDIIVDFEPANLAALLDALSGLGYKPRLPVDPAGLMDTQLRRNWINNKNLLAFTFISTPPDHGEIDIVLSHNVDFVNAYEGRVTLTTGEYEIPLISLSNLITMKTAAGRNQDLSDLKMLKKIQNETRTGTT